MNTPCPLDDLAPAHLLAVLHAPRHLLTAEESDAVVEFCDRIGGRANAIAAAEMLCALDDDPSL